MPMRGGHGSCVLPVLVTLLAALQGVHALHPCHVAETRAAALLDADAFMPSQPGALHAALQVRMRVLASVRATDGFAQRGVRQLARDGAPAAGRVAACTAAVLGIPVHCVARSGVEPSTAVRRLAIMLELLGSRAAAAAAAADSRAAATAVVVIGGGPAGLAMALHAWEQGAVRYTWARLAVRGLTLHGRQ